MRLFNVKDIRIATRRHYLTEDKTMELIYSLHLMIFRHIVLLFLSFFHCYALAESSGSTQLTFLWNCFLGLVGLSLFSLLVFHGASAFILAGSVICLGVYLIGYSDSLVSVGIGVFLFAWGASFIKGLNDKD